MKPSRITRTALAVLLAIGGVLAVSTPAHAACGDTAAEWVGSTGSVWTGELDGSTAFTAAFLPPVLGLQAAATVIVPDSGAGTWVRDYSFRWSSTAAGVWSYTFEVSALSCDGGMVTSAQGGATDGLNNVHGVTMERTL